MTEESEEGGATAPPWKSDDEFKPDKAWKLIQDLRADKAKAADRVKELEPLAAKAKELEDASRTELEKAQAVIAELNGKVADLPKQIRGQVLRFASKASSKGFLDPEDALAFVAGDLDLNDAAAIDSALDELAERKPHLVRKQPAARVPARPKPAGGDDTDDTEQHKGKERAAAAFRQFRTTR